MLDALRAPILKSLAKVLPDQDDVLNKLLAPPTKAGMADLSLPCFQLSKAMSCPPPEVAHRFAAQLKEDLPDLNVQCAGPFLNIQFSPSDVAKTLLPLLENNSAWKSKSGIGKTACIDFSSPNIAKQLAFHHLRSTMIGNALAHIYSAANWDVKRINFLGDWGTAFGRLIAGWKRESLSLDDLNNAEDKVAFLNALYVRISQAAKDNEEIMDEARSWSKKLEDGDSEARELWQIFKDASLSAFNTIYQRLGVEFDSWKGEAYYEDKMDDMLQELQDKELLQEDDGAQIVDLSSLGFKKPCLIKRADGGTLYATRDLTACQDRFNEFHFDRSLYVVDLGQSLHFKEWFAVAKLLNKPYAEKLQHIGFGVVLMWDEEDKAFVKGKTRDGKNILLSDVLDEAVSRADTIIAEKNAEMPSDERAEVAQAVGIGAVVFNDLKNNRQGDVKFKFEEALAMQGDTGPYIQYSHARLCSIIRKCEERFPNVGSPNYGLLQREDEKELLLCIGRCPSQLDRAVHDNDPSIIAQSLLELAAKISSWLSAGNQDHSARVLCDDAALANSRKALVAAARNSIADGLALLGLRAPERM